ncbi:MAG TPA: ATP-binding cassette domain-containing protein [Symbiobacteriaceae bacterium]|jgi:putative ABC transport system ATP-binding protein
MAELFTLEDIWLERPGEKGATQVILGGITGGIAVARITCLVGASGSGKSTLLRLLNRLEDPTRGRIRLRGQELTAADPFELRRRVGLVLQTPVMLPGTVRENLSAGLRIRGQSLPDPERWLERVGLPVSMLDRDARELSGGEKQRIALARTLVPGPEVLLLDEVTSSLDAEAAAGIEQLIQQLGVPVIWVSHDLNQVRRLADRVYRLQAGQLTAEVSA